ncbi:MAG TPA: 50S ribosomal protein L10 [Balneolales bacterium]|nr:50S ribosomal protein L10 [Balneolales bacterium]
MATKAEKQVVVEELKENLQDSEALYIANYSGMSVAEVNSLRGEFKKEDIKYKVYKNTLVQRAMDELGGYEPVYDSLAGQTAFIFTKEDLGKPAKILKKFFEQNKKPSFQMAFIEGQIFDSEKLNQLASMKSKQEVIGDIIGLLLSPVSNIVSGLQAQGSNILGAVKQIADKEEN